MELQKNSFSTIDEYIATFPEDIQKKLQQMRRTIQTVAPQATEKISYQMPTFFLNGNLVHFAAFKNHIGFYPVPTSIEKFKEQLSPYKTSKGGVQFPLNEELPLNLIKQIVNFRVEENSKKAKR